MAEKCSKVDNPETHEVGASKNTSTALDLDGRLKAIFRVKDVNDIASKDTLLTNVQREKNFFEFLNRPEGRVVLKRTNLSDEQITQFQALVFTSFKLAEKFKPFRDVQEIAFTAMEHREVLQNRYKTDSKGNLNKVLLLDRELIPDFTAVVVEADKQQINFTDDQLKNGIGVTNLAGKVTKTVKLGTKQIAAFKEHKRVNDIILSDLMDSLDYVTMLPFQDKPFIDELKSTIEKKTDSRVYEVFGNKVLEIVQSENPNDAIEAGVDGLIGENFGETAKNLDQITEIVLAEDPALSLSTADIPKSVDEGSIQEFKETYAKIISRKSSMQILRKQFGAQNFYYPRFRGDGKHILVIKRRTGTQTDNDIKEDVKNGFREPENIKYYKRYNSTKERGKDIKKLKSQFPDSEFDYVPDTQEKTSEYQFQNISDDIVQQFLERSLDTVRNGGIIPQAQVEALRNAMIAPLVEDLKTRGFGRQMVQRRSGEVIGGYETDNYKKTFNQYANGASGFMTKQVASLAYSKVLRETRRNPQTGEAGITRFLGGEANLYDETHRFVKDMLRNQSAIDAASGKVRGVAFIWFLTGQLRTPMVNLTQNFVLGIPELSKHTKFAEIKYIKAMFDAARLMFAQRNDKTATVSGIEQQDIEDLNEMSNRGSTGAQFSRDSIDVAKSQFGEKFSKTINALAIPFALTEKFNRTAAALAMLRVARENGQNRTDAINSARDFVFQTHFVFGKENLQSAARSGTGGAALLKTALTFRAFTTNYIFAMQKAVGNKDFAMIGRSLAYTFLLGGAAGLPLVDGLLTLIEKVTGIPFRQKIKNELKALGGEKLGDYLSNFGTKGIPALMGADISGSLKLTVPTQGKPTEIASQIAFGVWGGLLNNTVQGIGEAGRGRYLRAIEKTFPSSVSGPIRAARESMDGVRNFSGRPILDEFGREITPTIGETVSRGLGFQPTRLAEVSEERRQRVNITRTAKKRRQNLIDDFNSASTAKAKKKIIEEIKKFNRKGAVLNRLVKPIKRSSLGKRRKQRRAEQRAFQRATF